jgi:hypothetical protein
MFSWSVSELIFTLIFYTRSGLAQLFTPGADVIRSSRRGALRRSSPMQCS